MGKAEIGGDCRSGKFTTPGYSSNFVGICVFSIPSSFFSLINIFLLVRRSASIGVKEKRKVLEEGGRKLWNEGLGKTPQYFNIV